MISSDLHFNTAYPKLFMLIQTLAPDCTTSPSYLGQILSFSLEDEETIMSPWTGCLEPANGTVPPNLELVSKSWGA